MIDDHFVWDCALPILSIVIEHEDGVVYVFLEPLFSFCSSLFTVFLLLKDILICMYLLAWCTSLSWLVLACFFRYFWYFSVMLRAPFTPPSMHNMESKTRSIKCISFLDSSNFLVLFFFFFSFLISFFTLINLESGMVSDWTLFVVVVAIRIQSSIYSPNIYSHN